MTQSATTCILPCVITSHIPVTPDDELRYKSMPNGGASIEAFVNNTWVEIGETNIWPVLHKTQKLSIKCKMPHPYEVKLILTYEISKGK